MPEPTLLWSKSFDDCNEGVLGVLAPIADVQAWLPDGWVAADAQVALGAPAPTGRGLFAITSYACLGGDGPFSGADVGALVESPGLGGLSPATLAFYEPKMFSDNAELGTILANYGAQHGMATISSDAAQALPTGGQVTTEDGAATWTGVGAVPQTLVSTSRFWQEVDGGWVYQEWDLAAELFAGIPTSCELSGVFAPTGITSCLPGDAIVMQVPEWGADVEIWFLPA